MLIVSPIWMRRSERSQNPRLILQLALVLAGLAWIWLSRQKLFAILNVTVAGLVCILASPLSGAAFDAMGGRFLYLLALVNYFLGWLVLRATHQLKPKVQAESIESPAK